MVRWAAGIVTTALLIALWLVGSSAAGAQEVAGPPDSSHFMEVYEGSAAGGNIFNLSDGSHVGPNSFDPLPFFFVRTPFADAPQGLVMVHNPPLFDDGRPAVGIEVFQGDQRQGCGATPETTTFITGIMSGLAFNGESVGCLQLYDPTEPATIFIYEVRDDTILDYSFVLDPNAFPEVGTIVFEDGIGSLHPPDGPSFAIPNDLDGDGVPDLHDWVTGGAELQQPPTGPPPFPIIGLSGGTDGDEVLIIIDLGSPFDPAPDVFAAGLGFRLDAADGTSLVGGLQFIDGELFTDALCLPVPEDCSQIEVEAIANADKTRWTICIVPPPEMNFDPATAQMSASAFLMETADSPSLFQVFPEEGSMSFVAPVEEPEPVDEPVPVDQPESVDEPEPEPVPEAQEPTPEPVSEPSDEGGVPGGAIAVAAGAVIVAVGTAYVAAKRRKGKCDELRDKSDKAQDKVDAAVEARRQAIEAEARAMASHDQAATEAAREAIGEAEQAEREAWDEQQIAWNAYLDCVGEQQDAAHAPPPAPAETEVSTTSGPPGVVVGAVTAASAGDETATAPPPVKPVPCKENDVKDLKELETVRGSLTLAYTISSGTEGIRSTEEEAADLVNDLNEIGDQISEINDAIQDAGSGAGALIADAAGTVLELTTRLGAGAAAAANQMLENHRVYTFTYEEHRVIVDMRWIKFLRCVNGSWRCFYDMVVTDFHEISIPQTESFEGNRRARDARMRVFINKGENAVARDRPKLDAFIKAHKVGPC